uniref:Ultrabithorax n=1 Tax=Plectus sambesii TaxID=2011161 RepID=A0A914WIC8_9BILA
MHPSWVKCLPKVQALPHSANYCDEAEALTAQHGHHANYPIWHRHMGFGLASGEQTGNNTVANGEADGRHTNLRPSTQQVALQHPKGHCHHQSCSTTKVAVGVEDCYNEWRMMGQAHHQMVPNKY